MVLPVQVNRHNVHVNVHLHLLNRVQVQTTQKATNLGHNSPTPHTTDHTRLAWRRMQKTTWNLGRPSGCSKNILPLNIPASPRKIGLSWTIALRQTCLKALHNGHPGINKMLLRPNTSMFWPGISKQIAEYWHSCAPCQTITHTKGTIPIKVSSKPCKVLEMDFFIHKRKWFLIVSDYYSKYPYIKMCSTSSKNVISAQSSYFLALCTPKGIHLCQCKILY